MWLGTSVGAYFFLVSLAAPPYAGSRQPDATCRYGFSVEG